MNANRRPMTVLLDFDGTLVSQRRPEAFAELVKSHAVPQTDDLPKRLFDDDRFLCQHEIYDRTWLFRCFASEFPNKSPLELCNAFWATVINLQKPLDGCVEAIVGLRNKQHRLICATDTDGPGFYKQTRVKKLEDFFRKQCGIKLFDGVFIGSETVGPRSGKVAPPKGGLEYIDFILNEVGATKEECVMVGDKAKTDLLPAEASGISSVLVPNNDNPCEWPVRVQSLSELPALVEHLQQGVFISYSHADEQLVDQVEQLIQANNIKTWRYERDAYVGDSLRGTIIKAIRTNPFFLVVITQNSVRSDWVGEEIRIARKEMKHGQKWILPIVTEENVKLPKTISALIHADCSGEKFAQGMKAVIEAIRQRRIG